MLGSAAGEVPLSPLRDRVRGPGSVNKAGLTEMEGSSTPLGTARSQTQGGQDRARSGTQTRGTQTRAGLALSIAELPVRCQLAEHFRVWFYGQSAGSRNSPHVNC